MWNFFNNNDEEGPMNTEILNRFLQLSANYLGVRRKSAADALAA